MKLLYEYTLDYIKRNRRGSLAIMVAILVASTMMSAVCGFLYNMYNDEISQILEEYGNWHGELFDNTSGDKLGIIKGFDSVEAVMIKGEWRVAKIDDPRRDYLVWRDANAEYWSSMPEGNIGIIEGRIPAAVNEVALSKQYFEHHPELRVGDQLTLTTGKRVTADGTDIVPVDHKYEGEQFVPEGKVTLTVVGKHEVTTSSTTPAYTALGYLDESTIAPDDNTVVYLRFNNIRDTYKELPRIAAAVGYQPDEYGEYLLRYNTSYLARMLVLSPRQQSVIGVFLAGQMPMMFAVIGLFMVMLFVLVIHNAFALSAGTRLSQLGILASVGATPRQIKRSVVLEALLLTAIPLPLGIAIGQGAVWLLLDYINRVNANVHDVRPVTFASGLPAILPAILPAVLLTLLTVWWSAVIPARRVARLSPIVAIRQGSGEKLRKPHRFSVTRLFGLSGELAGNALAARRSSYRTATLSLTLSFLVLASFLCINSASTASKAIFRSEVKQWDNADILVRLDNVTSDEDFDIITSRIASLDGVTTNRWYNNVRVATWVAPEDMSEQFVGIGGFDEAAKTIKGVQLPLLRDGNRRVYTVLVGLDDATFADYCADIGVDPAPFYRTDSYRSILYNSISDFANSTKRNPVKIPLVNFAAGDRLNYTEKTTDDYLGEYEFALDVVAVTDKAPNLEHGYFGGRFNLYQIMPRSTLNSLAGSFAKVSHHQVNGVLTVDSPELITPTSTAIKEICESYYGSGDYNVTDEAERTELARLGNQIVAVMFGFVAGLLAIIGLSNAWSTVLGTLAARRREFAMLRSVGLSPQGIRQMLTLEALILGARPIMVSLPIVFVLQWVFLSINEVTFVEWLPYAPWLPILLYTVGVLSVIVAAYSVGHRNLTRDNIIAGIRQDMI